MHTLYLRYGAFCREPWVRDSEPKKKLQGPGPKSEPKLIETGTATNHRDQKRLGPGTALVPVPVPEPVPRRSLALYGCGMDAYFHLLGS